MAGSASHTRFFETGDKAGRQGDKKNAIILAFLVRRDLLHSLGRNLTWRESPLGESTRARPSAAWPSPPAEHATRGYAWASEGRTPDAVGR